jgi:pimeloyl-ACP methyl ester carboxylesterase
MKEKNLDAKNRIGCLGWIGRFILGIAAILALTGIAGTVARAVLRANNPPPGQMVDVGGYRMHLHCLGEGSPTVVVEAGQGSAGIQYANIQQEFARYTRVCVYDRAGLGWSDLGQPPRSAAIVVDELHSLLERGGVAGPYVLVGHSLGGLFSLLYTHTYPADVAGVVLIDSVHMDRFTRAPQREIESLRSITRVMPVFYGVQTAIALTGIPALLPSASVEANALPPDAVEQFAALSKSSLRYGAGVYHEIKALEAYYQEVQAAEITSLGSIPLVVLSHSEPEGYMGFSPEEIEASEQNWRAFQAELAALSSQGTFILAVESGHNIHLERPELVLESIQSVLQIARVSINR